MRHRTFSILLRVTCLRERYLPNWCQVNAKAAQVEIIVHKAQAEENFRSLADFAGEDRLVAFESGDTRFWMAGWLLVWEH